jgi:hypothetical protein
MSLGKEISQTDYTMPRCNHTQKHQIVRWNKVKKENKKFGKNERAKL